MKPPAVNSAKHASAHPTRAAIKPREGLPWVLPVASACLLAALVLSGCTMCQSPWDYCNAVVGPGGCPYCDFGARAGSIYAPMGPTPPTTPLRPTTAPTGKPAPTPEPAAPAAEAPPTTDFDADKPGI
jgi:hypothetical protein